MKTTNMTGTGSKTRKARRAGIALFSMLLLAACGDDAAEAVEDGAVVELGAQDLVAAEQSTLSTGVALTGTLNPYRMVEVKAQVAGVVSSVATDRGESVREGELLARIQAQGVTSQAASSRSAVAAAEANVALARRQLESSRRLFEAGALPGIDYRTAQTQVESAEAQLSSARAQAAGAVEQAAHTTVQSPISGEVSAKSVNEGEAVSPGTTLFTVVNSAVLELEGQVPVDQAAQVRQGQPVVFSLDAYPGREFRGTVARVAPVADPGTRQVAVVMRLPNEDRSLIGGLFATGRVITGTTQQVVVVPEAAVRGTNGGRHVLVVEDGIVARRAVTVGARDDARGVLAIQSGLRAGEQVITAPGEIMEGATVRFETELAAEALKTEQES